MAHKNKVMHSVNREDGFLCVDIFRRPDGTYGFDEFRRDPEDPRGWYTVGHHGHLVFESQSAANAAAKTAINWFGDP